MERERSDIVTLILLGSRIKAMQLDAMLPEFLVESLHLGFVWVDELDVPPVRRRTTAEDGKGAEK
jgi:hypothetical protein